MGSWYNAATIFQWNANGLGAKIGDFRNFINSHRFPVLALSEPRVNASFRLSHYVVHQSAKATGVGRAMLCIRQDLPHDFIRASTDEHFEFVACTVQLRTPRRLTVVSAYVAPNIRISDEQVNDFLSGLPQPFIICGDFNAHSVLWGSEHSDARGRLLEKFIEDRNLIILNDGSPTFFRGHRYSSCLDITICSATVPRNIQWATGVETLGSDHMPVLISLPGNQAAARRVRVTDWRKFTAIAEDKVVDVASVDHLHSVICDSLASATKVISAPPRKSPVDIEYERLRAIRRRAERRFRRTGDYRDFQEACRLQAIVRRHMQRLARRSWQSFCSTLSPYTPATRIWQTVKSLGSSVEQRYPFQALALHLGVTEDLIADDFCRLLSKASSASSEDAYASSAEAARRNTDLESEAHSEIMNMDFNVRELRVALRSTPIFPRSRRDTLQGDI